MEKKQSGGVRDRQRGWENARLDYIKFLGRRGEEEAGLPSRGHPGMGGGFHVAISKRRKIRKSCINPFISTSKERECDVNQNALGEPGESRSEERRRFFGGRRRTRSRKMVKSLIANSLERLKRRVRAGIGGEGRLSAVV